MVKSVNQYVKTGVVRNGEQKSAAMAHPGGGAAGSGAGGVRVWPLGAKPDAGQRAGRAPLRRCAMREEQARNDSLLLTERYPAEVDREAIVIPQPEGLFE